MKPNKLLQLVQSKPYRLAAPLMGFPGAALTETSIKDNLCDSRIQLQSLLALAEKVKPDIVMPMMDLSVECEMLGLPVSMPENESPTVEVHPVAVSTDLKELNNFDINKSGRVQVFLETVEELKKQTDAAVCAYVCGPFTLAGLLMGATEILMASYDDAQNVKEIISFCQDIVKQYSIALENHGADSICILDPTAVMLSPSTFSEFAGDYVTQVVAELKIPSILHICGNTSHLIGEMSETGVAGLSLDMDVDIVKMLEAVPKDVVVMGNIDSKNLMPAGKPEEIQKATQAMLNATADFDNFIPSTGCDLPPETPVENITMFSNTVHNWNR
jgi:uroporphyrinogen decarboxylase